MDEATEKPREEPTVTLRFLSWLVPALDPPKVTTGRLIAACQVLLLCTAALFPPFRFELPGGAVSNGGFHFIFSPPTTQHVTVQPTQIYELVGRVDMSLLLYRGF